MFSSIMASETTVQKSEEASESNCGDPCQECQRTVYQMKFQGLADCEGACRGTCYKVKEAWNTPFNPFDPFLKDVFGKCEICFRAGHCTISQCKEQERNEIEVINRVINSSHFTARTNAELLASSSIHVDANALPKIVRINKKVEKVLKKDFDTAVLIKSAQEVVPKVQNLITYVNEPAVPVYGAYAVLNGVPSPVSSAAITFANTPNHQGVNQIEQTKNVVKKIGQNIQEIQKLKQQASKQNKKAVSKILKNEKKELNKVTRKVEKLANKLAKKEQVLTRLANSHKVTEAGVKNAINNSLNQVRQYASAVNSVKSDLRQNRVELISNKRHN